MYTCMCVLSIFSTRVVCMYVCMYVCRP